jgi:hypothetical protein
MSANHHRPARKVRHSQPAVSATATVAAEPVRAATGATEVAVAAPASVTDQPAAGPALPAVAQRHVDRLAALLDKAERAADGLIDNLNARVQRRENVYPGELMFICRGLHVLARCITELGRACGGGGRVRQLTADQVDALEARLVKRFGVGSS